VLSLEQTNEGCNENRGFETDSHLTKEALACLEVQVWDIQSEVDILFILVFFDKGNCTLHIVAHLVDRSLAFFMLRLLFGLSATSLVVQHLLLRRHRYCFMLVGGSLVVPLLRILLWNVDCMLCLNCEVFVLEAL
jgi:hypothetical protein